MLAASADMAPWAPPFGEAPPPPPWPPQEPQSLEDLRSPLPAWAPSLAQPLPWMPPQALEGTSRASGLMPPSFGPPMMPGLLTGHPQGRRVDSMLDAQLLDDVVARRMQVETSRTDEAWQRQLNEERLRHQREMRELTDRLRMLETQLMQSPMATPAAVTPFSQGAWSSDC